MKNSIKRIITFILSVMLIITMYQPAVVNASVIHVSTDSIIDVTGKYKDIVSGKVVTYNAQYSDKFFTKTSTQVNGTFAKLSACASASAYKLKYAKNLLKACGFSATTKTVKVTKKSNDHVSYAVGHKKVGNETYIAVIIRGENGYEWISDFNLGKKKTHNGFSKAEKELNKNINSYIKKKKIKGTIKFWVTGHGRGGAVANLYAKRLSKKYKKENVYAFTFGAPRVSKSPKTGTYWNINNYVLSGDFIAGIIPSKWGFERYGRTITIFDSDINGLNANYKKLTGYDYSGLTNNNRITLDVYYKQYVGDTQKAYNTKKSYNDGFKKAPSSAMKNGFAMYLAGKDSKADKNIEKLLNYDKKFGTMLSTLLQRYSDGVSWNASVGISHSPSVYMAYLYNNISKTTDSSSTEDKDKDKEDTTESKKDEKTTEEKKQEKTTEKKKTEKTTEKPKNNNTTKTKLKEGETTSSSDKEAEYKVTKVENKGKYVEVAYQVPNNVTTKVVIPNQVILSDGTVANVTSIEKNAFKGNKTIKRVVIGKNIKTIGNGAFSKCTNLSVVTFLGTDVEKIGNKAFYGCSRLGKIIITKNVKTIGKQAFYKCKKLKKVTVASTKLKKVGKKAFAKTYKKINFNISIDLSKKQMKKTKSLIKKSGTPKKAKYAIYL